MSVLDILRTVSIDPIQAPFLYHYRGIDDLEKIIHSQGIVLWAGHVDQMNDEKEFKTGLDVIKSNSSLDGAFHKTTEFPLKKRFPYQLSLSLAEDSEHMWQNYGNSIGVMLILESRIITSLYPNTARCVYDNTIEFERIQQYVSSDKWLEQPEGLSKKVPISEEVWENLTMFVYLAKSYDYQEEEEVRIFGEESKNVILRKETEPSSRFIYPRKH